MFFGFVLEAKARILGPGDLHVKAGSSVTLTCVISQGPHDLGTVFWYKGSDIVETFTSHPNDADVISDRLSIQVKQNVISLNRSIKFCFFRINGPKLLRLDYIFRRHV